MNELKINNSIILIKSWVYPWINEYYQYIVSLLKLIINKNNLSINIILGDQDYNFHNENKTIKIDINYEHTLVKKNGRGFQPHTQVGKIIYDQTKHYFVLIGKFNQLNSCDIVIDYSIPNIFNVKESELFDDFSKKHIYIAPSLYKKNIENRERTINSLSTFINVNEPRRKVLLEKISKSNLNHINRNNCFEAHVLEEVYQNTKILINIHQTPHHDTFEELRCLPALQNGVIVVAEKSPLNHLIPYNDLIIWSDYDNIIEKTAEVLKNYDDYFKKIFTNKNIELLYKMDDENRKNLEDKIIPTFNVVIATIGRKCLLNLLKSLENQLNNGDCLTIIFDGVEPLQEIYDFNFLCEVKVHHEIKSIGSKRVYDQTREYPGTEGGTAVREFYKDKLEKRDFIMHADDDDEYLNNTMTKLRETCIDKECLYIARVEIKQSHGNNTRLIIPRPSTKGPPFGCGNISTQNGIIPYDLNKSGRWKTTQGGDGYFYGDIQSKAKRLELIDQVIYRFRPHEER